MSTTWMGTLFVAWSCFMLGRGALRADHVAVTLAVLTLARTSAT